MPVCFSANNPTRPQPATKRRTQRLPDDHLPLPLDEPGRKRSGVASVVRLTFRWIGFGLRQLFTGLYELAHEKARGPRSHRKNG